MYVSHYLCNTWSTICLYIYVYIHILFLLAVGQQTRCGGVRVSQPLSRHHGRDGGRTKRNDRWHGLAGHRLSDQRVITTNHVRGWRTTWTSQRVDFDKRHGPWRQSGKTEIVILVLFCVVTSYCRGSTNHIVYLWLIYN